MEIPGMKGGAVPRRVAIVGNAPELVDQGRCIDSADWVVRFNNTAGFEGVSGRRVTHLTLVNHGGQMREWLQDPGFVDRPVVRGTSAFLFPFAPKPKVDESDDDGGRDWTVEALAMLSPLGAPVAVLPDSLRREADAILGIDSERPEAPSTGFLVALHLLQTLPPAVTIDVHGFGFAGWSGHRWKQERAWFEAQAGTGRLRLHPIDRPAKP